MSVPHYNDGRGVHAANAKLAASVMSNPSLLNSISARAGQIPHLGKQLAYTGLPQSAKAQPRTTPANSNGAVFEFPAPRPRNERPLTAQELKAGMATAVTTAQANQTFIADALAQYNDLMKNPKMQNVKEPKPDASPKEKHEFTSIMAKALHDRGVPVAEAESQAAILLDTCHHHHPRFAEYKSGAKPSASAKLKSPDEKNTADASKSTSKSTTDTPVAMNGPKAVPGFKPNSSMG